MIQYEVQLKDRSYPILIGEGVLESAGKEIAPLKPTRVLIVTNETIAPLYEKRVLESLKKHLPDVPIASCVLPDGEEFKNMVGIEKILDAAHELGADRASVFVALGGGVVGDMAGFAASLWMRGIRFVQIPTTLLAQVDSSVGGKTGVNLPYGKNLIGAFHQPKLVLIDPTVLKTLPQREISAGLGEVIKYGILGDKEFFSRLEKEMPKLRALDLLTLEEVIAHCCDMKAHVVRDDEKEHGVRALLNLGHTFAHAIEKITGYGHWLHGEAVGAGMVMAAALSRQLGFLSQEEQKRIEDIVYAAGLPTRIEGIRASEALSVMHGDKKVHGNDLRFVLIHTIGSSATHTVGEDAVSRTMAEFGWN